MKDDRKAIVFIAVAFAIAMIAVLLLKRADKTNIVQPQGVTNFQQLSLKASTTTPILKLYQSGAGDLVVFYDNTTPIFQVTDGGAVYITGTVTLSANPILPSESITPTANGVITPTDVLVTLTPASAVTITLGACTTGQQTFLYNSVDANVVITDTGNGVLAGNQTLTQYDVLPLVCFGAKWVQITAVSQN